MTQNIAKTDILIIGSGPAGLQASIQSVRRKVDVLVTGRLEGSALAKAHIENLFGLSNKKSGMEMLRAGKKQAEQFGAKFHEFDVIGLEKKEDTFIARTEDLSEIRAKAVIFAMGVKRKGIGIKGMEKYLGKGLSHCADCDCRFFRGKDVVVVGNESAAASSALVLRKYAKTIFLISEKLKVSQNLKDELKSAGVILVEGRKVVEVLGKEKVEGVKTDDGNTIKVDGIFLELGSKSPFELAVGVDIILEEDSSVHVDKKMATSVPGVFACGDVTGKPFQLSKAIGEGCVAGISAAEFVKTGGEKVSEKWGHDNLNQSDLYNGE